MVRAYAPAMTIGFTSFLSTSVRAVAFFALATAMACDGLDNFAVEVGGDATGAKGTIVDTLLGVLPIDTFDHIDITQELDNQGVTKDDVDSVTMTAFTLTIVSPSGQTFDFLDSLTFYAESEGLPRVRIATLAPVPDGKSVLELDLDDVDLTPYVTAPSMGITSEVSGARPDETTKIHANVVLDVDVNVPGC